MCEYSFYIYRQLEVQLITKVIVYKKNMLVKLNTIPLPLISSVFDELQ